MLESESFVGEKERKTIEALVYTPASDAELFVGKVLASVLPSIALAWWPLILWVTPAFATLGMAVTVLISTRVITFMEAYQMSASLVVLVLALVVGQITGVLYLSVGVGLAAGLVLWAVDALLIWMGVRIFSRERLLSHL